MAKGTYLKNLSICLMGRFKHNHADIKKWIQSGGGMVQTTISKDTTHVVVSQDQWKKNLSPAVAQHDSQLEKIHIVSYNWLEDSMHAFSKRSERAYLWQKLDQKQQKKDNLKQKEKAKTAKIAEKEAERLQKAAAKADERKQKAAAKAATTISYRQAFIEHINTMGDSADNTRSSKELLAEKKHIYTDGAGTHFDTDLSTRTDERVNLTLAETDSQARSYGVHIEPLNKKPKQVKTAMVLGVNVYTALRTYKKLFKENTGVDWDNRAEISARFTMKGSRVPTSEVIEID